MKHFEFVTVEADLGIDYFYIDILRLNVVFDQQSLTVHAKADLFCFSAETIYGLVQVLCTYDESIGAVMMSKCSLNFNFKNKPLL